MSQSPVHDAPEQTWKILVVDDEPAIHQVTKLALRNLHVMGRPSQLISALSAQDAKEQLARHPDIALALLDVVMETDSAGLDLVKHIREHDGNAMLRIILRTGQPGQAPERQVMVDYDINDYKEKTELTSNKLVTAVMAGVRTYHQLHNAESLRDGADALGGLNSRLFAARDDAQMLDVLVRQFAQLGVFGAVGCRTLDTAQPLQVLNGELPALAPHQELLDRAQAQPGRLHAGEGLSALCLCTASGARYLLQLEQRGPLTPHQTHLVLMLVDSAAAALAHWAPAS